MSFKSLVDKNFDFLIQEYDFQRINDGIGYVKGDLKLEFCGGNGQVDINFFIKRDDDIFKPFVSRSFAIDHIIRKTASQKLESYPKEIRGYLTEQLDINLHLQYYSRMLREHGEDILNGNQTIFEQIHKKRREVAQKA